MSSNDKIARLVLADGSEFIGKLFGACKSTYGEVGRFHLPLLRSLIINSFCSFPNWHGWVSRIFDGSVIP